ncbi:hypothetical protein [Paraburkholderia ultramafica]|uniref:hypothetical protein n=1 Tax=Paraburkholderia ultramafica TaxID=1544867 RepID=UPI001582D265|nr:hypothetical protein [Paraburkholderia ultramafica]
MNSRKGQNHEHPAKTPESEAKKEQSKKANNTARKNPAEQQTRAAKEKNLTPPRGQKKPITSARNPDQSQTDT